MKGLWSILFWVVALGCGQAQPPSRFYSVYGGYDDDIGYACKVSMKDEYLVLGSSSSGGNGQTDIYLLKLDSMGQRTFEKYIGGAANDIGKTLLLVSDSGFIIGGTSNSFGNGGYDMFLTRTDKDGNTIWQKSFGGDDWDIGQSLAFDKDSNIVFVGNSYSTGTGSSDGFLVVCDLDGNVIAEKYIGGAQDDEFVACVLTSNSLIAIAGNTKSYGDLNNDFWLVNIDSQANVLGSYTLGTSGAERCYDMLENSNSELVFCGSRDTSNNMKGKNISLLILSDLNGNFIKDYTLSGAYTDDDKFTSIAVTQDGQRYILARKVYNGFFNMDVQPYLIDTNFNFVAATTYGGEKDEEISKVIVTKNKGFLMIGQSNSYYGNVDTDIYLLKLDSSIYSAQNIVDLKEPLNSSQSKVFYFNGVISFVDFQCLNSEYRISSVDGQILRTAVMDSNKIQVPSSFVSGIYFLEVFCTKRLVLKFVVE